MDTTKQLTLDINKDIYQTIDAKQNDANSRFIEFALVDNGLPCNLTGNTVKIFANKADGNIIFNNVTIKDAINGLITTELTSQALAVVGELACELVIYGSDNSILSSKVFIITVIKSIRNDSAIESQNEFTALTEALSQTQEWNDEFANEMPNLDQRYQDRLNGIDSSLAENTKSLNDYVLPHKLTYKTVSITTGYGTSGTSKPDISSWTHIKTQGADATLCVMVGITSATDYNPQMISDSVFTSTLADAEVAGIKVKMVKLHLGTNYSDGFDRGSYLPSDVSAYFTNWQNICLHYAQLCKDNNIPILCIGCEQPNQSSNNYLSNWATIANAIKSSYPDMLLTYAAKTWEMLDSGHQQIYSILDIIGGNVYLTYTQIPLSQGTPSLDSLCQAFYYNFDGKKVIDIINTLADTYNKSVFITEIGCMPVDNGLVSVVPYNYSSELATPNYDAIAWLMKAAFTCLFRNRNVIGFGWWHVDSPFCYFSDNIITSAEQVMIDYVKGGLI